MEPDLVVDVGSRREAGTRTHSPAPAHDVAATDHGADGGRRRDAQEVGVERRGPEPGRVSVVELDREPVPGPVPNGPDAPGGRRSNRRTERDGEVGPGVRAALARDGVDPDADGRADRPHHGCPDREARRQPRPPARRPPRSAGREDSWSARWRRFGACHPDPRRASEERQGRARTTRSPRRRRPRPRLIDGDPDGRDRRRALAFGTRRHGPGEDGRGDCGGQDEGHATPPDRGVIQARPSRVGSRLRGGVRWADGWSEDGGLGRAGLVVRRWVQGQEVSPSDHVAHRAPEHDRGRTEWGVVDAGRSGHASGGRQTRASRRVGHDGAGSLGRRALLTSRRSPHLDRC